MERFLLGVRATPRGVSLLCAHPRLLGYWVAPVLVSVLVYSALAFLAWHGYFAARAALASGSGAEAGVGVWGWLIGGLEVALGGAFIVLFVLFVYFTFVAACAWLGAPFHELLSARVESLLVGDVRDARRASAWLLARELAGGLLHSTRRIARHLLMALAALPLALIPVVGPVFFSMSIALLGAHFLAWEGLEPCLSRRSMDWSSKRAFLRRHRWAVFGYGVVGSVLVLCPITALVGIPLHITGGACLYHELARCSESQSQEEE